MLLYEPSIPGEKRVALAKAVAALRCRLPDPRLPAALKRTLTLLVDEEEAEASHPTPTWSVGVSLAYDPWQGEIGTGPYAYTTGPCVWICERSFAAGQARLEAVLCHELVHVACGGELDAEAFERALFPEAASDPDPGDWESFRRQNWTGRFVYLRREGAEASARTHEADLEVCRFPIPAGFMVP